MATPRQRVKAEAAAFPVPQTRDDVNQAIARIGALQRARTRLHADKDEKMAAIDQEVKTRLEPLETEIKNLSAGIQTWCESRRTEMTNDGKVKFHNFPAGVVKWRMRPAKVGLRAIEMVLDALKMRNLERFIRVKEEVNKEAMLAEPEAVAGIPGIKIEQGEDFVIEPFETKLEEVA